MKRGTTRGRDKRPDCILMTTDTAGGVWNYSLELALGLSRMGTRVALAAMGGRPTRAARSEARRVPGLELYESTYKLEWMPDAWRDVDAAAEWLVQLAVRVKPDVVHLNNYVHGVLPWESPVVIAGHSCVFSWWEAVRKATPPVEWTEYKKRVSAGLAAADVVVAPTKAMLHSLQQHYGAMQRTQVIPNGRSIGVSGPAPRKEPMLFASGRMSDEAKNMPVLEQIAARISWPIYVAGDTEQPGQLPNKSSRIVALGRLHTRTMSTWMSRASIFVHPARYEPFGLAPLEAGYAGCALVLSDIPSHREIWEDAALFVDTEDASALTQAVTSLIANEKLRRDLGQRALERAQMYAGCRMLASYRSLYGEMLAARGSTTSAQVEPALASTAGARPALVAGARAD